MSDPVRPWQARGASRHDPFAALEALQNRLSRTFGYTFGSGPEQGRWHPDVDLEEDGDGWVVEVRLPGVAPDEVSVDVTDRELYVRSRTNEEDADVPAESAPATTRSRRFSEFSYRVTLPSEVDPEGIDATMDHGLLTIRLPRATQARSRKIEIGRRSESSQSSKVITGSATPTPTQSAAPGEAAQMGGVETQPGGG
jgi:HSP20 family protein